MVFGEERKNVKFTGYNLNECFFTPKFKNNRDAHIFEAVSETITFKRLIYAVAFVSIWQVHRLWEVGFIQFCSVRKLGFSEVCDLNWTAQLTIGRFRRRTDVYLNLKPVLLLLLFFLFHFYTVSESFVLYVRNKREKNSS